MNVTVDVINASAETFLPSNEEFQLWSQAVIKTLDSLEDDSFELSIRIIDEDESEALNHQYRQKIGATNILSFLFEGLSGDTLNFLGDLAICAPVVKREAEEQNKTLTAHWAHMTVHGMLHLNAYDHENSYDAKVMEDLEIRILNSLGFSDPYH